MLEDSEPIVESGDRRENVWPVSEVRKVTEAVAQRDRAAEQSVVERAKVEAQRRLKERYRGFPELSEANL